VVAARVLGFDVESCPREVIVRRAILTLAVCAAATLSGAAATADSYGDTVDLFKAAGTSSRFFDNCYGYAVFPTIGKGAIGIGGAHGKGRVFEHGKAVGSSSMTQLSIGFQLGGEAFSQIVFFQDERAFREFTRGQFEFGAGVSAVVITAAASGSAGSSGASAGASGGKKDATTAGKYHKGMAVFTIVKGGAMYELSVSGQKFKYTAGDVD
jgi:lipid-binding SYLF domain-containing protein